MEEQHPPAVVVVSSPALRLGGAFLSIAGLTMMIYLLHVHFAPSGTASFCDFAPGFSCDVVNKSAFSEILGIPVAVFGGVFFLSCLGVFAVRPLAMLRRWILLFTVFSLTFGIYLTGIEIFFLGSICLFCELSKVAMVGIIAVLYSALRKEKERVPWVYFPIAIALGAAFAAFAHLTRL